MALFPQVAYFFSSVLGFASPSNFIFLYTIGILVLQGLFYWPFIKVLDRQYVKEEQELAARAQGDDAAEV